MSYMITQEDLTLVLQRSCEQKIKLRVEVLDDNQKIVGIIEGIVSGSMSINGESDVRRTANFVVQPTYTEHITLNEGSLLWLNKNIRLFVGLYNTRTRQYKYYTLGYYVYTDISGTYDAATNSLTINCADYMKKIDGTKNGQLGALMISYPVEATDDTQEANTDDTQEVATDNIQETISYIPTMTSNQNPSGLASCNSKYSSETNAYCAFDSNIATNWLSSAYNSEEKTGTKPNNQWLKYEFDSPVSIKYITFVGIGTDASFLSAYAATIYFDMLDSDDQILTTLSVYMSTEDVYSELTAESNEIINDVKAVRVRFSGKMRNGKSIASNQYVSCAKLQAYGIKTVEATEPTTKYNIIRNAVIETLEKLARITNHRIDEIGEYKGIPDYNEDWKKYREENKIWNTIPYDQEFSAGCSVLSILTTFRDLYPNYEMFFDMEDNTFICQLKPMCYVDDIYLDDGFLQKVLVSENTSVDMTSVRNICEVWGKVIEVDFYSEECSYKDNIYSATVKGYEKEYYNGDIIGLKLPTIETKEETASESDTQEQPQDKLLQININKFGDIGIYNEANDQPIKADKLKPNNIYAFKIRKRYVNGKYDVKAYLLGQWQVHAINVLTNGKKSGKFVTSSDGEEYELYSKEYFQKFYNCERVDMVIIEDSPFTIEKLGEIPDVKIGNEYDNITSDDLAADRAKWENWKNSRLTDNITITTALLPFLDVNKKVSYKRSDSDTIQQYIISSISHDFTNYTSTITMYRFYPLYESIIKAAGTHKVLSDYTHGVLSKYTQEELVKILSGEEL